MSTNVSKQKREELLRQLGEIRNKLKENTDSNTQQLLTYLSNIEKDIDGKRYGLVFEEHREAVDTLLENNVPIIVEDETLKIYNGGTQNFLIEGDNLASLKLLEKTHKGKIDFVYIDPPYNTGNKDFVYDDTCVDLEDKFRHSKWLSFMKNRLLLTKKLLTKKGLVVISINDNENAQLKILCDEIFGENNFIANLIWKSRQNKDNRNISGVSNDHEYMLCYSNFSKARVFRGCDRKIEQYKNPDNDPRGPWVSANMAGILDEKQRPNCHYDLIHPITKVNYGKPKMGWRYDINTMNRLISENRIIFPDDPNGRPRRKVFLNELSEQKTGYSSIIGIDIYTRNGTSDIDEIFEKRVFQYAKPVDLIKEIVFQTTEKNHIVLDFFAGSGTTGHAVMKLNAEDGGKRKFILCTNNENNICRDVTYERIKRVISKENYKANLKYYKVDFEPITDKVYYEYADKLLLHIKELVELENGLDFEGNKKVAIALTDDDIVNFSSSLHEKTTYKAIYVGHDVFISPEVESKLQLLKIKINRIPDYYYNELRG